MKKLRSAESALAGPTAQANRSFESRRRLCRRSRRVLVGLLVGASNLGKPTEEYNPMPFGSLLFVTSVLVLP